MSAITTHVLDTAHGRPAAGVRITLERRDGDAPGGWIVAGRGVTDADGRARALPEGEAAPAGVYRLTFESGAYFRDLGAAAFHPRVQVTFEVGDDPAAHYHVPLLVSPFGYTTYRGS